MKKFIHKNLFLIGLLGVLILSFGWPWIGTSIKEWGLISPMTFAVMFLSGLGLPYDKIKGSLRDYKSILYAFVAVFLLFPAAAFTTLHLLGISEGDIFVGMMILAAQAGTLSSAVVLTMSAGGNVSLALIITIVTNMASVFVTPVLLNLLLSVEDQVVFNTGALMFKLVTVILLPVVLAQITSKFIRKALPTIQPWRKGLSQIIVLLFILTGASTAASQLTAGLSIALLVLGIVVFLHLIMLGFGLLFPYILKRSKENRTAVLFCSSQKTLPAALMVWGAYFSQYTLAPLVLVSYHVIQLFIDAFVVNTMNKRY